MSEFDPSYAEMIEKHEQEEIGDFFDPDEAMSDKLSERMPGGSFSRTNDGVLTCDECGREPEDSVRLCSSHEDLQHKKEVAALEARLSKTEAVVEAAQEWADLRGKLIYESEIALCNALAALAGEIDE